MFASLHAASDDVSLNQPVAPPGASGGEGRGRELVDLLAQDQASVDEEMIHRADLDDVADALNDLDRNEREVVRMRYGFDDDEEHTLQEIGDRLHLSRERVRQIETRAKEKLRRSSKLRNRLN